jgi:hypothetical protein
VAVDSSGTVDVADQADARLQEFTGAGALVALQISVTSERLTRASSFAFGTRMPLV